jgi:glycosyltransferase involved in cell wall biosynthesis
VIFQNPDNRQVFVERGIVELPRTLIVHGSGVNVEHFSPAPLSQGEPVFLLIARLLGDKGIREYVRAAALLKEKYPAVVLQLVGPDDPSPDGIPLDEVKKWHEAGVIQYLGSTKDVRPYLAQCHVYVLPSYHEGTPRSVLEAMAMGRPVVTTDAPGCRETVQPGENGYLVPTRDAEALARAMERFILEPGLIGEMGSRSRRIAEQKYDVHKVNAVILQGMGLTA